ncbi:ABC transporter ATP-binding protein [Microbacterium jejuense]|uniref:ABC transporter ATP-binding protein n=1 Tax=Microbacterium jejuense TaxID=1263637 RepID=UPI0031E97438
MTSAAAPAIEVRELRREYRVRGALRRVTALDGLSLTVAPGTVHGLLGPNGAGKTTLCKILATVLVPTNGSARVAGFDVERDALEVRRRIGLVLGGDRGLYAKLSARQNLEFWAAMYGMPRDAASLRIDTVIDQVGLGGVELAVERFSRGMKQRLHLARGLLPAPEVLLLDEPTTGMDPVSAHAFRDLVRGVVAAGSTVLLTTHDMAEAEALCTEVSMIDGGRLLATSTPRGLGELLTTYERIDVKTPDPATAERVRAELEARDDVVSAAVRDGATVRVETQGRDAVGRVLSALVAQGLTQVAVTSPSLDEVYVHVIGDRGMDVR